VLTNTHWKRNTAKQPRASAYTESQSETRHLENFHWSSRLRSASQTTNKLHANAKKTAQPHTHTHTYNSGLQISSTWPRPSQGSRFPGGKNARLFRAFFWHRNPENGRHFFARTVLVTCSSDATIRTVIALTTAGNAQIFREKRKLITFAHDFLLLSPTPPPTVFYFSDRFLGFPEKKRQPWPQARQPGKATSLGPSVTAKQFYHPINNSTMAALNESASSLVIIWATTRTFRRSLMKRWIIRRHRRVHVLKFRGSILFPQLPFLSPLFPRPASPRPPFPPLPSMALLFLPHFVGSPPFPPAQLRRTVSHPVWVITRSTLYPPILSQMFTLIHRTIQTKERVRGFGIAQVPADPWQNLRGSPDPRNIFYGHTPMDRSTPALASTDELSWVCATAGNSAQIRPLLKRSSARNDRATVS